MNKRTVCWFSCGAASSVATYLTLKKYPDALIVRIDTGSEHIDNERFMADCERWYGRKITVLKSDKYSSVDEVIDSKTFLRGPHGAPCTGFLKKAVRYAFQEPDDLHIFGFHTGEQDRAKRLREIEMIDIDTPLIDYNLDHADCRALIQEVGIELPEMYKLGFQHNNCIGCVKSSGTGYWNLTRKHFPDVFAKRAEQERRVDYALCKIAGQPIFLDELPENIGNYELEQDSGCSILCQIALSE